CLDWLLHLPFLHTRSSSALPYTLPLHDALPISASRSTRPWIRGLRCFWRPRVCTPFGHIVYRTGYGSATEPGYSLGCSRSWPERSEEHTSELQSRFDLVCRLLLEKKTIIARTGS